MIENKSILITGHTGLIGSALWTRLRGGNDLIGASRSGDTVWSRDGSGWNADSDYIINAAGYASPSRFMADPMGTIRINTTRLMDMIAAMKPGARLLFLSSSEVYSGSYAHYRHMEHDIGTTTPEHPRAAYIEGKRCGEAICHAARAAGKDVVIARVSSVYGPGFRRGDTRVVPQFVRMAVEDQHVGMKDRGAARRSWLYVEDCVDMLMTIMERGTQAVYNVGGTEDCSIAEIAEKIADAAGCSYGIPAGGDGAQGAPTHVNLDVARYNLEFGAPRMTTLDDGVAATVDWYRQTYA